MHTYNVTFLTFYSLWLNYLSHKASDILVNHLSLSLSSFRVVNASNSVLMIMIESMLFCYILRVSFSSFTHLYISSVYPTLFLLYNCQTLLCNSSVFSIMFLIILLSRVCSIVLIVYLSYKYGPCYETWPESKYRFGKHS